MKNKLFIPFFCIVVLLFIACGSVSEVALQATVASIEATTESVKSTRVANETSSDQPKTSTETESYQAPQPPSTGEEGGESIQLEEIAIIPPEDALFFDDFSNNKNGWGLISQEDGTASLVLQRLRLSAKEDHCLIAPIPNLIIEDNFYAEVSVELDEKSASGKIREYIGIAFGSPPNGFFKYGIEDSSGRESLLLLTPDGASNSRTKWSGNLLGSNKVFNLGIEAYNGLYTLYYNGEALESLMQDATGNSLALFTCDWGYGSQTYFDNVLVKESR